MSGAAEFEPGTRIDRYEIVRTIGSGSSGTVYEAIDERLERPVAIKFAAVAGLEDDAERKARFTRDARFAASLSHPNLCPVYDFGIHEGRPYLVMALLPGATLADLVARHAPLAAERIVVLLRPIAEALAEMHRVGLYHGDLKPHNILLDARLEPLLTDFGLMRPERFDRRGGPRGGAMPAALSPAYQAPEQLHEAARNGPSAGIQIGPHIGPAADMHALGVILYVLLTGRLPFAGTPQETIQKIREATPAPPSSIAAGVPRDLEQICLRLLRKDPSERPSAIEVARRLRTIADRGPALLGPRSEPETLGGRAAASEYAGTVQGPGQQSSPAAAESVPEDRAAKRPGPTRSLVPLLLVILLLPLLAYAIYVSAPWERITPHVSRAFAPQPTPDAESAADGLTGDARPLRDRAAAGGAEGHDGGRAVTGGSGGSTARDALHRSAVAVDELEPGLPTPPGRLFVRDQVAVTAAATLPASPEGNAVVWWDLENSGAATVPADSLVPARQGTQIAGVLTSASGETVAILGQSWYGRVAASGGTVATNRVVGWLTVERAATSPSGRFALLQPTGVDGRKRIGVWDVVDRANPEDRMAIYCDAATTALALSANGRGMAYGDQQGQATIQRVGEDPQILGRVEVAGPITALAFSPDNLQLAIAHQARDGLPAGVVLFEYDATSWQERRRIETGEQTARHLSWSPGGEWLGGVMQQGPLVAPPAADSSPSAPAAAAADEGPPPPPAPAWLWRMQAADAPAEAQGESDTPLIIPDVAGTAIGFVSSGRLLVGHGDGVVRHWELPPLNPETP